MRVVAQAEGAEDAKQERRRATLSSAGLDFIPNKSKHQPSIKASGLI